jgi:hypothetical protein
VKGYQPYIQKACGCSDREVGAVEELMRLNNGGVLDALRPGEFDREARHALAVLQELRRVDPETAARLCG